MNVASGLEEATRELGCSLVVSDACVRGRPRGHLYPFEKVVELKLRGRASSLLVHVAGCLDVRCQMHSFELLATRPAGANGTSDELVCKLPSGPAARFSPLAPWLGQADLRSPVVKSPRASSRLNKDCETEVLVSEAVVSRPWGDLDFRFIDTIKLLREPHLRAARRCNGQRPLCREAAQKQTVRLWPSPVDPSFTLRRPWFVRKAFVVTAAIAETARRRIKGVSAFAASSFESLHQGPGERA